jgi:hypothetical protein
MRKKKNPDPDTYLLVTNGSGCGSRRPKIYGSYESRYGSGSRTLKKRIRWETSDSEHSTGTGIRDVITGF